MLSPMHIDDMGVDVFESQRTVKISERLWARSCFCSFFDLDVHDPCDAVPGYSTISLF